MEYRVPTWSSPVSTPSARRAALLARWAWARLARACGRAVRPAGVSRTFRGSRSSSGPPRARSRAWIWCDRPGWLTCSSSAARVKEPSSTTVTKYSSWRSEINMHIMYHFQFIHLLDKYKRRGQDEATSPAWRRTIPPDQEAALMPALRVLCLHGYHGTGATLRRQMASLAGALPADIKFVYIDART